MSCKVWKVREVAANAFAALVGGDDDFLVWLNVLLNWGHNASTADNNAIHGGLCAGRNMIAKKFFTKVNPCSNKGSCLLSLSLTSTY